MDAILSEPSPAEAARAKARKLLDEKINEVVAVFNQVMDEGSRYCHNYLDDYEWRICGEEDERYIRVFGYWDGDIMSPTSFSFPMHLLNEDKDGMYSWMRKYREALGSFEKIQSHKETIVDRHNEIKFLEKGVENLSNELWIRNKIKCIRDRIVGLQLEVSETERTIEEIDKSIDREFLIDVKEKEKVTDLNEKYFGRRVPRWRDICSNIDEMPSTRPSLDDLPF